MGGLVGGILLLLGVFIYSQIGGGSSGSEEETPESTASGGGGGGPVPEGVANGPVSPTKAEAEARYLYEEAHGFAKRGDVKNATRLLTQVVESFPKTKAAKSAQEALDNPRKNLPLFVDTPAISAKAVETGPPPEEKKPDVVAVAPKAPSTTKAEFVPPPTPPDAYKTTNLPLDRVPDEDLKNGKVQVRPLPAGFRPRFEAGVHPSGWPLEITCDKDGAAMVFIPGGEFTQGRDAGPSNERPAHRVVLAPYYIDQHEVTVRQYGLYDADAAKKAQGDEERPMSGIGARDARSYNQWAGKELPTEAQWEMAARATDARLHPWGNSPPDWLKPREPKQIDPVMSFPGDLSPYGVFDMAGNAWEWTNDIYDLKYYAQFKTGVTSNPAGASKPSGRVTNVVIKGGGKDWVVSWREGRPVETHLPYLGFRGVLNVEKAAPSAPGAPPTPGGPLPKTAPGAVPF